MNRQTEIRNLLQDWIERDTEKIVSFLSELVQCKTPSPPGDTRSAMALVEKLLNEAGIGYQLFSYNKTMPNLVSSLAMANPGPTLMLNGHLDVMPAGKERGWIYSPWSGEVADEKVWGRGTSDMKAGVTAMLFAYIYASRLAEGLGGKLSLSIVSDEETGYGRGTGYLFRKCPELMEAECVLSAEPSGVDAVSFASKGYVMFEVSVHTRGAIAGYEDQSKNAIEIAAHIINELKAAKLANIFDSRLKKILSDHEWLKKYIEVRGKDHKNLLSRITLDICSVSGGTANSATIAPECRFTAAAVIPLGTDIQKLVQEIKAIVQGYPEASFRIISIDEPDYSDPYGRMIDIIRECSVYLGGPDPVPTADIAISDCRYWRYKGIPAYWYGPGGEACGSENESVSIPDLLHTVRVYGLAISRYLSKASQPATG